MHITSLSTALVLAASTLVAGSLNVTEPGTDSSLDLKSTTKIVWDTNIGGKVTVFLAGGTDQEHLQQCGVLADGINNVGHMDWTLTEKKPDGFDWYCSAWANNDAVFGIEIQTLDDMEYHWGSHFKINF
ncbi:hypothetical protein SLS62_009314 [Diatrype stigma]|uniref:Yeast cell wall synthesis Kre9/Knh1-like N-terminal domain-containing protein n=1 Tax=Diatrype stigma TaxID=117547 RepID=A0AAN9UF97_9PEZI